MVEALLLVFDTMLFGLNGSAVARNSVVRFLMLSPSSVCAVSLRASFIELIYSLVELEIISDV